MPAPRGTWGWNSALSVPEHPGLPLAQHSRIFCELAQSHNLPNSQTWKCIGMCMRGDVWSSCSYFATMKEISAVLRESRGVHGTSPAL